MAPMSDDQYGKARLKVRDAMMRLALRKVRDMRNKYGRRPPPTGSPRNSAFSDLCFGTTRAAAKAKQSAGGAQEESAKGSTPQTAE